MPWEKYRSVAALNADGGTFNIRGILKQSAEVLELTGDLCRNLANVFLHRVAELVGPKLGM